MTLLDAPVFDEKRYRRRRRLSYSAAGLIFVMVVAFWLAAGRPVDWPWNWSHYFMARRTVNTFLSSVEKNDLPKAYGIWIHDKDWQQHPQKTGAYSFSRFQEDWSGTSPDNDYGIIQSHKIALAGRYGNGVLVAILINGRKSGALNLDYDPASHTLSYAPPGVALYLGP